MVEDKGVWHSHKRTVRANCTRVHGVCRGGLGGAETQSKLALCALNQSFNSHAKQQKDDNKTAIIYG